MTPEQRMAHSLLAQVASVSAILAAGKGNAALSAIASFVAEPRASRFLVARRALSDAARSSISERTGPHVFRRALETLGAAGLEPDVVATLADLGVDARAASRLDGLASLFVAHAELAARAAAATAAVRARLERPHKKGKTFWGAAERARRAETADPGSPADPDPDAEANPAVRSS